MFRKYAENVFFINVRFIKTSSKCAGNNLNVSKRDDYYKNLGSNLGEQRQEGWDEAIPFEDMPGPKALPVVGNTWRFLPLIGEFYNKPFTDMYSDFQKQYGNVVKMEGLLGRNPIVALFDPIDMENMLRNEGAFPIRRGFDSFIQYRSVIRKEKFKGVGGVLTVDGEEWFRVRSTVNPIMMQPRTVQQYTTKMDKIASELVTNMKYFATLNDRNEMPELFLNELYKWALESIGVVALNKRIGCLDLKADPNSEAQRMIKASTQLFELFYYLEITPPIWKFFKTPTYKKFIEVMDFLTDTAFKYIDEGLKDNTEKSLPEQERSVLYRLRELDKQIAIAMVMDLLLAGIETTGKTMGAALYLLAKHPEKQAKLREELKKYMPNLDSPVTNETLANLPYLKAVIKETTRITPIAIANSRTTVKDMVLGGYRVPRDTDVITLHLLSSQLSSQYKTPLEFIPERWLRSTTDEYSYKNAHSFATLPFGFGPRSCIGRRFANLELEVGLAKIIRNLELSWHQSDMTYSSKLFYGLADPLRLTIRPQEC